jgi:hypothetical protein
VARKDLSSPEARALRRVKALSDLVWHSGIFVVVNAFLWIQDAVAGGGIEYAYWTTIPWAFGLLLHYLAFFSERSRLESRRYERYLAEEKERELQPH